MFLEKLLFYRIKIMKNICQLLNKNENEAFAYIIETLKEKITKWDYFVNWERVFGNITPIEQELNLLNYLVGKKNIEREASQLIQNYPSVIKAIPRLLAIRGDSVDVLIDVTEFLYDSFDFTLSKVTPEQARKLSSFLVKSGLGDLLKDKRIKNLVDYTTGVEVGIDSNARKNRTGTLMESIVEVFIAEACKNNNARYLKQASVKRIKSEWNIDVKGGKSRKKVDFAIKKGKKLYFIETNFYGGGGSKLKSTAGEYITVCKNLNRCNIEFIWITDGSGWRQTQRALRDYFDQADFLLNLQLLQEGILSKLLRHSQID